MFYMIIRAKSFVFLIRNESDIGDVASPQKLRTIAVGTWTRIIRFLATQK